PALGHRGDGVAVPRPEGAALAYRGRQYARGHGDRTDPRAGALIPVPTIFTIGYEQATQAQVIGALKAAGVTLVIDVRAVAASRRAGFSKTILASSLKAEGIGYVHLRALGTPKAGRQAAHAGRIGEMHEIFEAHMAEPQAQVAYGDAAELAAAQP